MKFGIENPFKDVDTGPIEIQKGFSDYLKEGRRVGVICPDCGSKGANAYPCWCHNCESKVLMLPTCNGILIQSWSEYRNHPALGRSF